MNEYESKVFDAIIDELFGSYGKFDIEISDNDVIIEVAGRYEREYSRDTNYYSGTGEVTTTYASVGIQKCIAYKYTEEGEQISISDDEIDVSKIATYVEDYMYNY